MKFGLYGNTMFFWGWTGTMATLQLEGAHPWNPGTVHPEPPRGPTGTTARSDPQSQPGSEQGLSRTQEIPEPSVSDQSQSSGSSQSG